ncbi:MAG: DUF362 domain-containing protein [Chitinispirillaceae bacterium]|nr:DUF362 domain-containing protein [Chitinispirillaceae bacterium]
MTHSISRRDFLKTSSAAGLAAAIPVSAVTASAKKNRIVIATDATAVSNGSPVAAKINDLVDHAIMTFTGKSDKAAAYAALFPAEISGSTKILMKRNDASGLGAVNTAVTDAFKNGLVGTGKITASNITIQKRGGDGSSYTKAATYIINCPVAWEHIMPSNNYGVTLSLKNTMTYIGPPSKHHSDSTHAWLWNNSLSSAIKTKQVLSLMDAVVGRAGGGPGGEPDFVAGTIIVSNDLVAVDYQTIQLMKKQTKAKLVNLEQGEKDLRKAETAGLGTCTPANMEIINISPPNWGSVGTINGSEKIMRARNVRVINQGKRVDFVIPGTSPKQVAIVDMMGNAVWQRRNIPGESVSWDHTTVHGIRVPSGMYIFRIICGGSVMRGTVMVCY